MDRSYPQLYEDEFATKARATLRSLGLRVLPVVDERKRLVGMVSRGDVMVISSSVSPIRVKGVMSTPKFVATIDMDSFHAVREMIRLDEWYIPIVKSSQDYTYMGVVGLEKISLKPF
jgi:CBS domain-containing protein